jgi:hypothetical protein
VQATQTQHRDTFTEAHAPIPALRHLFLQFSTGVWPPVAQKTRVGDTTNSNFFAPHTHILLPCSAQVLRASAVAELLRSGPEPFKHTRQLLDAGREKNPDETQLTFKSTRNESSTVNGADNKFHKSIGCTPQVKAIMGSTSERRQITTRTTHRFVNGTQGARIVSDVAHSGAQVTTSRINDFDCVVYCKGAFGVLCERDNATRPNSQLG